jgi:UDP-4-amino-4-deoxy-L-arabinose formyltransferase/UDP-glucuronic acid dehydrogenase (UDP-4-keto-hexauronic acid decarboxylating)
MAPQLKKLLLVGDGVGLPALLDVVPADRVGGLCMAANRPQYHEALRTLARTAGKPLLVQSPGTDPAFLSELEQLGCDGLLCYCYSLRLRREHLEAVGGQAFNVHGSLLPLNRGPNPVQWAIIKGESVTGVTLHRMTEAFDQGAILAQREVPILFEDTWVEVMERVGKAALVLLREAVPDLLAGRWQAVEQDEARATRNPRLTPDSPRIDFGTMSDLQVYNLIRAQVAPLKGAYIAQGETRIHLDRFVSLADVAWLRASYVEAAGRAA